ncbi:MAG: hypothetical protein ACJA0P_002196 [Planctomycetota bacterium]|jgi:hypothetical protein
MTSPLASGALPQQLLSLFLAKNQCPTAVWVSLRLGYLLLE